MDERASRCKFLSRDFILTIIHIQLQLTKIEQCATAAVYCQIMDAIYPGTFSMSKIKWGAKFDYEYVENYKVLQNAFDKNGIKKHIDVDKLCKAKYQDNLEFCQWIKRYFDLNYSGEPYNAVERRKGQQLFYIMGGNKVAAPPKAGAAKASGGTGKIYSGKSQVQDNGGLTGGAGKRSGPTGIGGSGATGAGAGGA